ncbi:hypothetical protein FHR32_005137 [Streptosporangium album]|uniref:Uncharacterized protein n=1 Tax=Streptosporangium album TaxID=47479 RepID=A0A7W7RZ18_9ACTN|nr:hypothetical protein [Streptosporangium album]MBB4940760.1 hypothetical protein [Streptosporangium album]
MPFKDFTTEILTSADVDLYLMSQVIIRCTSSTRPTLPAQGWHIYETDTNQFLVYNGSTWVQEGVETLFKRKTADESVVNSTTVQDDNDLTVTVGANRVYDVLLRLKLEGGSNGDFSYNWTLPSGASIDLAVTSMSTVVSGNEASIYNHSFPGGDRLLGMNTTPATASIVMQGLLIVGGTSGAVTFRWAQATSSTTTLFVKATSYMILRRLA